jgi:hypothetical protein
VSDTQQEQVVEVDENRERREARERAYQDVSLRAVELLAKAQRAADEAVAEAQSYARDLEQTAREQYRHILQRAHEAAREASGSPEDDDEAARQDGAVPGLDGSAASGLEAKQLEYVRTYARVAHSQLKAVLGALNDELDRLADLAEGPDTGTSPTVVARGQADGAQDEDAESSEGDRAEHESDAPHDGHHGDGEHHPH